MRSPVWPKALPARRSAPHALRPSSISFPPCGARTAATLHDAGDASAPRRAHAERRRHLHVRIANAADAPHPIRLCGKRQRHSVPRVIRAAERADGLDQRVHAHIVQRAARQNRDKARRPQTRAARPKDSPLSSRFHPDAVPEGASSRSASASRTSPAISTQSPESSLRICAVTRETSAPSLSVLFRKMIVGICPLLQQPEERRRCGSARLPRRRRPAAPHPARKARAPSRRKNRRAPAYPVSVTSSGSSPKRATQRRLLGKNRDAARAFHRVIVHECVAVIDASARANHARAPKQLFAERRLARIDMRRNPQRQIHGCSSACPSCASRPLRECGQTPRPPPSADGA